jgi:anaerobic ribonucleoside-triphosphate reductase
MKFLEDQNEMLRLIEDINEKQDKQISHKMERLVKGKAIEKERKRLRKERVQKKRQEFNEVVKSLKAERSSKPKKETVAVKTDDSRRKVRFQD